jgi:hypothetical protein
MKWPIVVAALILMPAIGRPAAEGKDITLRGCVVSGLDKDTFVLSNVSEVTKNGASTIPPMAHGRRVVFWLDKDDDFNEHVGQTSDAVTAFSARSQEALTGATQGEVCALNVV